MYDKMFQFVKDYLVNDEAKTIKIGNSIIMLQGHMIML